MFGNPQSLLRQLFSKGAFKNSKEGSARLLFELDYREKRENASYSNIIIYSTSLGKLALTMDSIFLYNPFGMFRP